MRKPEAASNAPAPPSGALDANAGCLDRCEEGPCVVIYPEGIWYTYFDRADVDEIIESHLINGKIVERLRLPDQAVAVSN